MRGADDVVYFGFAMGGDLGYKTVDSNIARCVIPAKPVLDSDRGAGIHSSATLLDTCFRRYDRVIRRYDRADGSVGVGFKRNLLWRK